MMWATMILAAAGAAAIPATEQRSAVSLELRGYVPGSCGASLPSGSVVDAELEVARLRCSAAVNVSYTRASAEEAPLRVWVTPL